jgi:hypothetical protein
MCVCESVSHARHMRCGLHCWWHLHTTFLTTMLPIRTCRNGARRRRLFERLALSSQWSNTRRPTGFNFTSQLCAVFFFSAATRNEQGTTKAYTMQCTTYTIYTMQRYKCTLCNEYAMFPLRAINRSIDRTVRADGTRHRAPRAAEAPRPAP